MHVYISDNIINVSNPFNLYRGGAMRTRLLFIIFRFYCTAALCVGFFFGGGMKVVYWPFKSPISFCMKLGFGVEWIPKYPKQYEFVIGRTCTLTNDNRRFIMKLNDYQVS